MIAYPCVSFVLPFCLHIPDDIYDVVSERQDYLIQVIFLTNKETPYSPMTSSGPWEIYHDAFGRTGNTKLSIIFKTPIEKPTLGALTKPISEIESNDLKVLDLWKATEESLILTAIKVGNRLLEVYRDQDVNNAGEPSFHIFPLTEHDISNVRFYLLDQCDQQSKVIFEGGTRPYFRATQGRSGRSSNVVQRVKNSLLTGSPIPIWRILLRNAQNWLWRADFRLVPVEINTAFEIIADEALTKYVGLMNFQKDISRLSFLDELILIQKLSNEYRHKVGKPILSWAPVNNQRGWEGFLTIQGRQEIATWYRDCYFLRKKVVHEGFVDVKKSDAEVAIRVTEAAIEFLKSLDD